MTHKLKKSLQNEPISFAKNHEKLSMLSLFILQIKKKEEEPAEDRGGGGGRKKNVAKHT